MSRLEDIIANGNRGGAPYRRNDNWITCADGFKLSVIAGGGAYCTPRPAILAGSFDPRFEDVPATFNGPFSHVEVGYPSARPEPWRCTAWKDGYDRHDEHPICDGWAVYADSPENADDWGTVFGYVPVDMVRALIAAHGGKAS